MTKVVHTLVAASLLSLAACAELADSSSVADAEETEAAQEISEATCATASPDFTLRLSFNLSEVRPIGGSGNHVFSPTSYNNPRCARAWIVHLVNSPFDQVQSSARVAVDYGGTRITRLGTITDEIPLDDVTCTGTKLTVLRYAYASTLPLTRVPRLVEQSISTATFVPFADQSPFPGQPRRGICHAPRSIVLSATPPGPEEVLAVQVIKPGNVTEKVMLSAR